MKNFLNSIRYMPVLTAIFMAAALAVTSTMSAAAAVDTTIEGNITVRNVTDGVTVYTESTSADENDVVRFKVWYHNTELATSEKVAQNLSVKVDFPTTPGATQNVGVTIKGDNTNTVTDSATVNVGDDNARLEYIPGTAKWQRNVGTRENIQYEFTDLSDNIVTGGAFVRIEDQQPCFEYEAFVYFDAKIMVDEEELKPIFECKALTALPAAVKPGQEVEFTATANADNGATINSYDFNFGDGNSQTVTTSTETASTTYAYNAEGTYNSSVTVNFTVDGEPASDSGSKCKAKVVVDEKPVTPPEQPPELPNTGVGSALAGFFGTSALFMSARELLSSRKQLRAGALNRR